MDLTERTEGVYKNLMEIGWFKRLLKWRGLQFTLQFAGLLFFLAIAYAGLFGTPVGRDNLASTFTWLIWWTLIPVTMLVAGRSWCLVCPWIAPGEWLQRLAFWRKGKRTLSLNLKVPKFLRNFGLMLTLFLVLHWADSTFHLAFRPETTVYLALGLFAFAIVISLVFEKRSFCKYFCPIGAVIAPYSFVAPIELRNRDPEVCQKCKTRDCINGNEKGYGCPMMIFPYSTDRNTHCVLCTECAKTCPNDNIAVNIRRPFQDTFAKGWGFLRTRDVSLSLSIIVIVLLGVIPFHNLEMTPLFSGIQASLVQSLGIPQTIVRTVLLLMMGLASVGVFGAFSWLARRSGGDTEYGYQRLLSWLAVTFIPLGMSLHLAHNYFHIFQEGAVIIANLSDPLGLGWNLFGTAGASVVILSSNLIRIAQFVTVGLGLLSTGYCLYRLTSNMYEDKRKAFRVRMPMLGLLVGMSGFYIWVLTIPMALRF